MNKSWALEKVLKYDTIVVDSDVRKSIKNCIQKLFEIEERIDGTTNAKLISRVIDYFTGKKHRRMILALQELTELKHELADVIIALAVLNAENNLALDEMVEEIESAKLETKYCGGYFDYLIEQIKQIKLRPYYDCYTEVYKEKDERNNYSFFIYVTVVVLIFLSFAVLFINSCSR